jgi:hypothetical protein
MKVAAVVSCPPPEPPVYFADGIGPSVGEPFEVPEEDPAPIPVPYELQRSAVVGVPPLPGL